MYRKILVIGSTAAVVLCTGTAALALPGSHTTTRSSSTTSASSKGSSATGAGNGKRVKHGKGGLLRRAEHGDIVIGTKKGPVTVQFARGVVTSVSSSAITVQSLDKQSETFTVDKNTKVKSRTERATKGAKPTKPTASSISKVSKGDHVAVFGKGAGTATAGRIVDIIG